MKRFPRTLNFIPLQCGHYDYAQFKSLAGTIWNLMYDIVAVVFNWISLLLLVHTIITSIIHCNLVGIIGDKEAVVAPFICTLPYSQGASCITEADIRPSNSIQAVPKIDKDRCGEERKLHMAISHSSSFRHPPPITTKLVCHPSLCYGRWHVLGIEFESGQSVGHSFPTACCCSIEPTEGSR